MNEVSAVPTPLNGDTAHGIMARGGAIQQIRSSFCTAVAVQKARSLPEVKRKLLEEARLMGEDAYYGWRAGKENIEGPSIDLAVAAARCWGNCATDMLPVQDMPDCWIFTAAFIDLETGYTRTRQFRQSKNAIVSGRMDNERKDDIRFQVGQSKAERNVIRKALPSWLINAALEAAKEGVRQELDRLIERHGLPAITDRLVSALGKCGAKEAVVLAKCGVAERKGLTTDHLIILRGDLNALQSGEERVEVLYPAVAETLPAQAETPSASEPSKPKPQDRKATKKTLASLKELADRLNLAPVDREKLCAQAGVQTFDELSDDSARSIIYDLEERTCAI